MVANPDKPCGFQTDSKSGFKKKIGIQIRVRISDFKSRFNPDFRLTSGFGLKRIRIYFSRIYEVKSTYL
jgi:hypothetical protein